MSKTFEDLVLGLAPRPHNKPGPSPEPRDRAVLFVLAHFADERGHCPMSLEKLARYVQYGRSVVRVAMRSLEDQGLVSNSGEDNDVRTYYLHREELEARQIDRLLDESDDVQVLARHGATSQALNVYILRAKEHRRPVTVEALGQNIAEYRALPPEQQLGFEHHLQLRGIGRTLAKNLITAYDAFTAEKN